MSNNTPIEDQQSTEARLALIEQRLDRQDELERELRRLRDLEEIRTLKARYWKACDGDIVVGPSHDVQDIVDLYTEDGSWRVADIETPEGVRKGRGGTGWEGIRAYFQSRREHYRFIMHFGMAPIITITGDTATGHWHYIATLDALHEPKPIWSAGVYLDEYVRTDAGWRIKNTVVVGGFATPFDEGWRKTKYVGSVAHTD
jgi:SnoaL-like domain